MYDKNAQFAELKGKTVTGGTGNEYVVTLYTSDGSAYSLTLDGDCCSRSYFTPEALQELKSLEGSTILEVDDRAGPSKDGLPETDGSNDVSWHFLVFVTDKGHVTVDWRNDSNGYYDGSVIFEKVK